jgi:cytochrome P450
LRNKERDDPISFKTTEQYQFVAVSKENMSFGLGRHACPGRFFAANEIKLILAHMLLNFDLRMPDGQDKRYENITIAHSILPDSKKEILVRRVTD